MSYTKNKTQITDLQYFGSINYYSSLIECRSLSFSPTIPYQKELKCNRTCIMGANGLILLSLPLAGGRSVRASLGEVMVAEDVRWRTVHWRGMHDAYRKAPWFDAYGWELEEILKQAGNRLYPLNLGILRWVLTKLRADVEIVEVNTQQIPENEVVYRPNGDTAPLRPIPEGYPIYQQVFGDRMGFVGNLSIIDLLMNEGPAARDYLHRLAQFRELAANASTDPKLD